MMTRDAAPGSSSPAHEGAPATSSLQLHPRATAPATATKTTPGAPAASTADSFNQQLHARERKQAWAKAEEMGVAGAEALGFHSVGDLARHMERTGLRSRQPALPLL
jgi:hypothetical protein